MLFSLQQTSPCIYIVLLISIFLSACSQHFYAPITGNIPNLERRGDLNIQGAVGVTSPSFGANVSVDYAATPSMGVSVKVIYAAPQEFEVPSLWKMQGVIGGGYYGEVSVGRFSFQQHNLSNKEGVSFSVFAGGGLGGFSSKVLHPETQSIMDKAEVSYRSMFVHPSAILRHKFFDFGISTRMAFVHFNKGNFIGDRSRLGHTYNFFQKNNKFLAIEPSAQLWINHSKAVRFQVFGSLTSMPTEIATNAVWGVGMQCKIGQLNAFTKKTVPVFDPLFLVQSAMFRKKKAFDVCKLTNYTK